MGTHRYRRVAVDLDELKRTVETGLSLGHCSSLTEVCVTLTDDNLRADLDLVMAAHGYEYLSAGDRILSEMDDTTTSGAVTVTVCEVDIPDGFFGIVSVDVSAEHDSTPADAYGYQNTFLVSGESGAATVRATNAAPLELDPQSKGVSVSCDASGQKFRVRATGIAAEDWTWAAHVGGLLHER